MSVCNASNFAIVDEVDSILIDEARTPLIISGQAEGDTEIYVRINALIPKLTRQETEDSLGDYSVDEKSHQVTLSESGLSMQKSCWLERITNPAQSL